MALCKKCGKELSSDEIGLHKKLINRGATSYMCIDCLSAFFECDRVLLEKKIEHFRNMGCTLFPK